MLAMGMSISLIVSSGIIKVYMCDSAGYLGSVGLLFYKEFFMKDISWAKVLMLSFFLIENTL
ncbi:DUF5690 family protein [Pedobacter sp. NJ-S-72]